MNIERRKLIAKALAMISEARNMVEQAQAEEQEYFDNMPESLQSSEKGEKASEDADNLQTALDDLENAESALLEIEVLP